MISQQTFKKRESVYYLIYIIRSKTMKKTTHQHVSIYIHTVLSDNFITSWSKKEHLDIVYKQNHSRYN